MTTWPRRSVRQPDPRLIRVGGKQGKPRWRRAGREERREREWRSRGWRPAGAGSVRLAIAPLSGVHAVNVPISSFASSSDGVLPSFRERSTVLISVVGVSQARPPAHRPCPARSGLSRPVRRGRAVRDPSDPLDTWSSPVPFLLLLPPTSLRYQPSTGFIPNQMGPTLKCPPSKLAAVAAHAGLFGGGGLALLSSLSLRRGPRWGQGGGHRQDALRS